MASGRPRIYETAEELETAIEAYFSSHLKVTITGLALALGFCDRQSLYDYEDRPEFSCIIKKARLRVECKYEEKLSESACTGAIFALKNMGWKDKTETEHSGEMGLTWNEVKNYGANHQTNTGS